MGRKEQQRSGTSNCKTMSDMENKANNGCGKTNPGISQTRGKNTETQEQTSLLHKSVGEIERPVVHFTDLPDDVMFMIFKFLSPAQLCCLCCVSRRMLAIASKDVVWLQHAKRSGIVKGHLWKQCSAMEVYRIAPHWRNGLFKQVCIAREKTRQIPWLFKEENGIWLSKSSCIRYFHVQPSGRLSEDRARCLQAGPEDLTRFTVKDGTVVAGSRDGSVCSWSTSGRHLVSYNQVHKSETHCVDFTDSCIVSGSRDTTCKVLRFDHSTDSHSQENVVVKTFNAGERVWSLKISPNNKIFAAGLAGCLDDPPVILWDLESGSCIARLSVNHRRGAGVLDLRFESPNELLTCGYDTFIRLWDLRTQTCIAQWEEPYDSALFCIDTDGENTMVAGTARHGMVRLWDKRHSEPVQMMYCKNSCSPVYSLAMDYGHLYLALDTGLTIMDFT